MKQTSTSPQPPGAPSRTAAARRQAKQRASGRAIAVILRNSEAIEALDLLIQAHGGGTAAISAAG